MSQEFINQHTVEHKGKQICKYFLEGRCIKVIMRCVRWPSSLVSGRGEGALLFFISADAKETFMLKLSVLISNVLHICR